MNEQLPNGAKLAEDLDELFRSGEKLPVKSNQIPLLKSGEGLKAETKLEQELYRYQVDILRRSFEPEKNEIIGDIRGSAEFFKKDWDKRRAECLSDPTFSKREWILLSKTDLFVLAESANKEHLRYVQNSGQALPGSPGNNLYQLMADRWGRISDIVKAASEIKD